MNTGESPGFSRGRGFKRTKRIYNNPRLKAPRYDIDDKESHIIHGIPFTKRSWICMGKCPECRDSKLEQKKIRKQRKEALRLELTYEGGT